MCYNENKTYIYEGNMPQKDLKENMNFVEKNREVLLKDKELD